jgi:methyl-accepting chemotaxis protein
MTHTSDDNDKLDILIDQVGRLTEGLTEIKGLVERVAATTERQAAVAEQQSASVDRLTQIVEVLVQELRSRTACPMDNSIPTVVLPVLIF